ncbi:oxidoreductase [Desulfolucanica intricata]|uniref:oxidoreductase n=1 Tax=Desulfolucanica intricata TaxID=1285191 RepID=UPI00083770A3|nr:NADH:flavin oxidoreductase [Desulfolucanica intricata]
MSNYKYKLLFEPIQLGPYTLKNRITMAPVYTAYGTGDGCVSPLQVEHYRNIARGGAAMIVVENAVINHRRSWFGRLLRIDQDSFIPELEKLARTIKAEGVISCCQISHSGRFAQVEKPVSASAVPAFDGPVPEEMTIEEIHNTIDDYVMAAQRVKQAGFDMVEIHGGTGYLPAQFLSPRTNLRSDRYGGSLENRMRFALEVVQSVKAKIGKYFPVGYRFMADEWIPGGLVLDEARIFARKLDELEVAYISVTAGTYESIFTPEKLELSYQNAYMADLAQAIKAEVNVPVIAAGRISTPAVAENLLSSGKADLVGLGRVLLADPLWPQKAYAGQENEIITCKTGCDTCLNLVMKQSPVICTQWPKEIRRKVKFNF